MDTVPSFSYQRFDSRRDSQSAFDVALESAQRLVWLFDRDGEFYGLDRPPVAHRLDGLLRGARDTQVILILQRTHFVQRDCARLLHLLQLHAPRIQILKLDASLASYERGFLLVDNSVIIRRPHFDQPLSFWDVDEKQIAAGSRLFTELVENSVPAVSANVAGL